MKSRSVECIELPDLAAMSLLGRRIAAALQPGDVIGLQGTLGAGKTTLARAILHGLGYAGPIPSPTFTLVELYEAPAASLAVAHADFYRLDDPSDVDDLGLDDYREGAALLAEWPEKAGGFAHEDAYLEITLHIKQTGRMAEMRRNVLWQERRF